MALKTPQQMQVTALDATPGTRFQSAVAPKIDTGFIDAVSKRVSADEDMRIKAANEQLTLAKARFRNTADALRIESQAKIADHKGVNAFKETPREQADYQKKLEKVFQDVPADYQQFIAPEMEDAKNKLSTMAVPHMHGQMRAVKDETFKTSLKNEINFAVEKAGELDYLKAEGLARVSNAAFIALKQKYGDDRNYIVDEENGTTAGMMIDEGQKKARSETVLGSINLQARLGPKGFANAEKIFESLDHEMTPADQVKALGFIKTAREEGESKAAITLSQDAIEYGGGDMMKTMEYALANAKTDKEGRITSTYIKDHFSAEKKQKAKAQTDLLSQANETALASGKVPWEIVNKMDGENQTKGLNKWNDNKGKVRPSATNYETYSKVSDELHSMDPQEAKAFNLGAYAHEIGPEQMNSLERLRNEKMKKVQDEKDKAQNSSLKDVQDITSMFIAQNELMPDQIGRVKELAYNEAERLKGDKNITIPQLKARMYQAMKKKGIFETKEVPGRFWGTNTETVIKETLAPDMSKIHESHKLAFRKQVLAKYKRLPTPAEEQAQLERLMSSGRDLTLPR